MLDSPCAAGNAPDMTDGTLPSGIADIPATAAEARLRDCGPEHRPPQWTGSRRNAGDRCFSVVDGRREDWPPGQGSDRRVPCRRRSFANRIPPDAGLLRQLYDSRMEHSALVFLNRHITDEQYIVCTRCHDDLEGHRRKIVRSRFRPEIFRVSNLSDDSVPMPPQGQNPFRQFIRGIRCSADVNSIAPSRTRHTARFRPFAHTGESAAAGQKENAAMPPMVRLYSERKWQSRRIGPRRSTRPYGGRCTGRLSPVSSRCARPG